jgi:hypothetical protein
MRITANQIIGAALLLMLLSAGSRANAAGSVSAIPIPDVGWHLWPDTNAAWQNDTLYLPTEVDLKTLPVNPPTGGWEMLDGQHGITVTLPSTVEQHFWGKLGLRLYTTNEYGYVAKGDTNVLNGICEGVSWWWREINIPADFDHKVVLLHIRGARQRAEVYVNHQLVGYNFVAETSFDCDVSQALRPGAANQIAIRITNPGGRMDWRDTEQLKWGNYIFQKSHGFGGLDRAITLTAHDAVYLEDMWVLNMPQTRTVTTHATVRNATDKEQFGTLKFSVLDPKNGQIETTNTVPVKIPARSTRNFEASLTDAAAEIWSLEAPRLYEMQGVLSIPGRAMNDAATQTFGFRWFEPRGIGERAGLYLNDQRIRLYTAISWGFWGLNGLWPTPELAEKEVRAAKQLGLNMLNFHRNIGKEEVLAQQDQLGLLRYMEAGGGVIALEKRVAQTTPEKNAPLNTSGAGGDSRNFAQKYEVEKMLSMIRQFRSHPSLVMYVIQNETEPDLTNPQIWNVLWKMHELDPSRIIVSKSGVSPLHQAWFAPYADAPKYNDGVGYSGWRDEHTVGGPGVWQDKMYQGPTNFTHRVDDPKEIVDWGEMLGAGVADNHPLMVQQIKAHGGESYDLTDHEELTAAYDRFLDRWGFRKAFPTDEQFYTDIGNKCYEFWGRVIETTRLCEDNDILSISGWESTAIENHSGLVDNLRNFKGDPTLIASKLSPLLPVVKLRASTCAVGEVPKLDLYLVNETGRPAGGKIRLWVVRPDSVTNELGIFDAPDYVPNQFVYPVKMDLTGPAFAASGRYSFWISLTGETTAQNSETVLVVNPTRTDLRAAKIGVVGDLAIVTNQLSSYPQLQAESYRDNEKYDVIILARKTASKGAAISPKLIDVVRAGTPLLALPANREFAGVLAAQLGETGAFQYQGLVQTSRASWMGNWVFVRQHPLYDGLPVDEVMKGDYQIPVSACYGLQVGGPGVEIVAAYGRDHDRNIGAATFTTKLGQGTIVFQTLTGMPSAIQQRLLANELKFLLSSGKFRSGIF